MFAAPTLEDGRGEPILYNSLQDGNVTTVQFTLAKN